MAQSIDFGDKVQDIVTGFEGVVIGKNAWMTGCEQCAVQPCVIKDGKLSDATWFDHTRLKVIKKGFVKPPARSEDGGPRLMH